MSESIQVLPSAGATVSQAKNSSTGTSENAGSADDSTGFTAVFSGYVESESESSEQQVDENLTLLLNQLMPQEEQIDGNLLPAEDQMAMWQAFMLLQTDQNTITNSSSSQLQGINLLDGRRQTELNSGLFNQSYFNMMTMQNKEKGNNLPAGFAQNNISMQLAAAHFTPETNSALLLNTNEQLIPVHGTNSVLSQGLAAVGLGTVTQAAATQTQLAPLNLGQNAWESSLASRLQMLVGKNVQTAEIRLDPPELGALEIKIKVINDVANVNIISPHAQVREALEAAIPRLREMFAETGVSLGDVNVGQESFTQQQNSTDEGLGLEKEIAESDFDDDPVSVTRKIASDHLLDFYA